MADGDSGGNISEMLGVVSDAIVKPVGEEMGKMIEVGAQSISASDDPQAQAKKQQEQIQKQQEDSKKAANIRNFFNKLTEEEQKARQETQIRDQQRAASEQQDKQKEQVEKFEDSKKEEQMNVAVYNAERSKEQRNGVGG